MHKTLLLKPGAGDIWTPASPIGGNLPSLWVRPDPELVNTGGARQFTAAAAEQFERADAAALRPLLQDISVSAWVYLDSVSRYHYVVCKGATTFAAPGAEGFSLLITDGDKLTIQFGDGSTNRLTASGDTSLVAGQWYHIAATYDRDGYARAFLDTVLEVSLAINGQPATLDCTASLLVGGISNATYAMNGRISRLGLWYGKLLSSAEIAWLNNSGNARTAGELGEDSGDGAALLDQLVDYWNLNEPSGNAAGSVNDLHLTDTNTVTAAAGPGTDTGRIIDGDTVAQVISKDANAYTFSQATAAKKPTWTAADANFNNRPSLTFDGVDDLVRYAAPISTSGSGTAFLLTRMAAAYDSERVPFSMSDEAADLDYALHNNYAGKITHTVKAAGTNNAVGANTVITAGAASLWLIASNGTATEIRLMGAAQTESVLAGAAGKWYDDPSGMDNTALGALKRSTELLFWYGQIAEIVIYDAVLTADAIARVERYFRRRYKLSF